MSAPLTETEKQTLLKLAREALESAVRGQRPPTISPAELTPTLRENGASFVTLTINGNLRGCIGALSAYQPLYQDVQEHAVAAGLSDPRFPQVRTHELDKINVEVSRLTPAQPLTYTTPQDLLSKLHPGVDGVILADGIRRATFLPQVWEKIPRREDFLAELCYKMGVAPDTWQKKHLEVETYQVEEFHE